MVEQVTKAYLIEIQHYTTDITQKEEGTNRVEVQFNPETLKLSFSNRNTGGDQPNAGSSQHMGPLTSQLSLELLFDTTEAGSDVREKTRQVARFIIPRVGPGQQGSNRTPPRTRFQWGTFLFEGIVQGMEETLDYFSAEGVPMRATISLTIKSDHVVFLIDQIRGGVRAGLSIEGVGITSPLNLARPGDSLQRLAGRAGQSANWKAIASANGIDDPLRLPPGALVNLNAGRS
jgi:hypothetical protein